MSEKKEQEKIKKIRERILKSGFPLEIEIGNILRRNRWVVANQWAYVDKESGKIRPVDVLAMKIRIQPPILGVTLLIECKKSLEHDWIIHTQEKEKEFFPLIAMLVDFLKKFKNIHFDDELANLSMGLTDSKLSGLHLFDKSIKIGVFNMISSARARDDFYIATNEIISALSSQRDKTSLVNPIVTFPVIVFDGEIFEFYQENDETKILPINHLQFMSFEKTEEAGASPCLIDVVRKSYFSEFLRIIERDFHILTQLVKPEGDKK